MQQAGLPFVTLIVFTLSVLPSALAEGPEGFDLVGEDPAGDADNYAVQDHLELPETFSRDKQDILELWMATDDETLHVKLVMAASYHGTSSLLFVVQFTVGDERYDVCWNVQSAGLTTQSEDINEDMAVSCSRINDSTRVGPTARDEGIEVTTDEEGRGIVYWPVPKGDIGGPEDGTPVTQIVATTWNRGINPTGLPSTSPQSQYIWNLADRAPDTDSWSYVLGGVEEFVDWDATIQADRSEAQAAPGDDVPFEVAVTNHGPTNATFRLNVTAPDDLLVSFPQGGQLELASNTTGNATLVVGVPPDAILNTTYILTLDLEADGIPVANLTIQVHVVDPDGVPPGDDTDEEQDAGSDGDDAARVDEDTNGVPGPGLVPVFLVLVAIVAALGRRRHETV